MQESSSYRNELSQYARDFEARRRKQLWRDDSLFKAERMLFVGFLFVRKLIECKKVTDACVRSSVTIQRSSLRRTREVSDFMRDDLLNDIDSAEWVESVVDVHQLADKIIHVWWIMPVQSSQGGLHGHIFTTDRKRNSELWLLPTEAVVSVFQRFSREVISSVHTRRDALGRLTYWQAT
ncbi:hypothetical protein [Oleiagrimonas sp. C23AA]|uniref:hypothetical protein n=1 Tax=Oleiagrimonas sp. C23AA TaxID=2719047 RepID=UPI0014244321|nr:hypothetical protein [Oleiagrimonas sp. C23AA]NII11552.1 hypothetical protein [Oleiagrimonas sp. C23AA]